MTVFDKRSEAFERQFAREEELRFLARARRDKLFGLWIAARLGLDEAAAADYALKLVLADMEAPGDKDVLRRTLTDLAQAGIAANPDELRGRLAALDIAAMEQVRAGVPSSAGLVAGSVAGSTVGSMAGKGGTDAGEMAAAAH